MPRVKNTHAVETMSFTPVKEHACDYCPKTFDRKSDCKRHLLVHTGEKPHACPFKGCKSSFKQPTSLKSHMNSHVNAKPHICGIGPCKQSFGDPSSCSRHRKEAHSGKIYVCPDPYCATTIIRKTAFVTHLKNRHGLRPNAREIDDMHLPHEIAQDKLDALKPMSRRIAKAAGKHHPAVYESDSAPSTPESSIGIVTPPQTVMPLPYTPSSERSYSSSPMPMYNDLDNAGYFEIMHRRDSIESSPFLLPSQEDLFADDSTYGVQSEPSKAPLLWDYSHEELENSQYYCEPGVYLSDDMSGWDRSPSRMGF